MRRLPLIAVVLIASRLSGQPVTPEPATCAVLPATPDTCSEGAIGDVNPESFGALASAEVDAIVIAAAAALDSNNITIAVVDRAGRVLGLYRKPGADPANDDLAAGVARTAAFFSHNQAPLSSRTVRFISGIHFPPGITNTPNAALYGIENTNRGCDFNVVFNPGKCFPRARGTNGNPCHSADTSGCGQGIVTGKKQPDDADATAVLAGGIPLYRILDLSRVKEGLVSDGKVVGGIGVVGSGGDSQRDEFAAVTGAFGALNAGVGAIAPVPIFPLPDPGNVFIDGLRLPFLGPDQKLKFNADGLPIGLQQLEGTSPVQAAGTYVIAPSNGGCAANEYLVGPKAGSALSQADVDALITRSVAAAKKTRGVIRLPLNSYARMVISVADTDGTLLAIYRMPDATVFSIDVSVAKARNVVYFSSADPNVQRDLPGVPSGTAVTNRTIGFGGQPFFPPGINSRVFDPRTGPFFDLFLRDLANFCSQGFQATNPNQNGIVFFPGATPLYRNGVMVGGLGVSGDGVEQDDYVTFLGAGSFLPDRKSWADQVKVDRVRLTMFKFPRQPEGVRECGGKPCG